MDELVFCLPEKERMSTYARLSFLATSGTSPAESLQNLRVVTEKRLIRHNAKTDFTVPTLVDTANRKSQRAVLFLFRLTSFPQSLP
jgi:hypothetical protein